jgi:hypothetical protein
MPGLYARDPDRRQTVDHFRLSWKLLAIATCNNKGPFTPAAIVEDDNDYLFARCSHRRYPDSCPKSRLTGHLQPRILLIIP